MRAAASALEESSILRGVPSMADYKDYRSDEEGFARELDDLAKAPRSCGIGATAEGPGGSSWEDEDRPFYRSRLIRNALQLRPDLSEAQASAWVDSVIGLEPAN